MKKVMKAIAALMLMTAVVCATGCKKDDDSNNGGNNNGGNQSNHEYVDLGLPSGILWATCNVGAETPEGYGDYFAWGETLPKSYYDWSNYKYCNGTMNQLTKYCYDSEQGYNGYTDSFTILQPDDDAATVNWGDDWRMPSKSEWSELINNCTQTWITSNGVNGRLFTASNGKTLFLPAAGYRDDTSSEVGERGCYWSRSLTGKQNGNSLAYDAGVLRFAQDWFEEGGSLRCNGYSVRPVRFAK